MAVHGGYRHLKRLAAPALMPIKRKEFKWLSKPLAGAHALEKSISLSSLLRDLLNVSRNAKESSLLVKEGEVLIDNRLAPSDKLPVGIFDVVSIPKINSYYVVLNSKSKLLPFSIDAANSKQKLCKVVGKTVLSKDKVQIALHDGRTIAIDKKEDVYATGDSVVLELPSQKILKHFKLDKGCNCYVAIGKHSGKIAVLDAIEEKPFGIPSDVHLNYGGGEKLITRKDYIFVVPKDFKF